jgi:hypothetical protein
VAAAGVTRVIWVADGEPVPTGTPESTSVSPYSPDVVDQVVALDNAIALP